MEKKIEITESSQRIANKREALLKEKFKDFDIWLDGIGSINIRSKNENIKNEHIMSIYNHSINLHNEKYLPTATEIAEFLGIYQIELQ